eukprot:IDg10798t1
MSSNQENHLGRNRKTDSQQVDSAIQSQDSNPLNFEASVQNEAESTGSISEERETAVTSQNGSGLALSPSSNSITSSPQKANNSPMTPRTPMHSLINIPTPLPSFSYHLANQSSLLKKRHLTVLPGKLTSALAASNSKEKVAVSDLEKPVWHQGEFHASDTIISSVNAWVPRKLTTFAQSYTSFFPVTADFHVALLDPRSGERLHVWGEPLNEGGDCENTVIWEDVLDYLENFLLEHSVEGTELGPLHYRQKPWSVSTRRVSPSVVAVSSSSIEEEDAAISTAIAASLTEANAIESDPSGDETSAR